MSTYSSKEIISSTQLEEISSDGYQNKQIPVELFMDITSKLIETANGQKKECKKLLSIIDGLHSKIDGLNSRIEELEEAKKESDHSVVEKIRTIYKLNKIISLNQQRLLEFQQQMLCNKMAELNNSLMNNGLVLSHGIDLTPSIQFNKDKDEYSRFNDKGRQFDKYLRCLENDDFNGTISLVEKMKISHKCKCHLIMPVVTKKREEMKTYPWKTMSKDQRGPYDRFRIYRNIICHHGSIYQVTFDGILHEYYAWKGAMGLK